MLNIYTTIYTAKQAKYTWKTCGTCAHSTCACNNNKSNRILGEMYSAWKNQLKKNWRLPDVYGGGVWTTETGGAVSPAAASCVVWRPVPAPGVDAAKRLGIGQRARVLRLWRAKQQYAQHSVRRIPGTIKINAKADEIPDNKSETTVSMNINVTNSGWAHAKTLQ